MILSHQQIHNIVNILIENSNQFIIPFYNKLQSSDIFSKNGNDIVTKADLNMEYGLQVDLLKLFPDAIVLGEENYQTNPEIFQNFEKNQWVFMIDPIDGTRNFVEGRAEFCVLLGVFYHGEIIASFTYLPLEQKCAIALKNQGAIWQDEQTIPKLNIGGLIFNELVGHGNFVVFKEDKIATMRNQFKKLERLRCAGVDFLEQAIGLRHFSLYRHLWWWDHVAGCLLLNECGASIGLLNNQKYDATKRAHLLLTASNEIIFTDLHDFFTDNLI